MTTAQLREKGIPILWYRAAAERASRLHIPCFPPFPPPPPPASPRPFLSSPGLKDVYEAHHGAASEVCSCLSLPEHAALCPPPSPSPPGPSSDISFPIYGPLGFFQQPEMNLRGPTGSAACLRAINHGWAFICDCLCHKRVGGPGKGEATALNHSRFFFFYEKGERKTLRTCSNFMPSKFISLW